MCRCGRKDCNSVLIQLFMALAGMSTCLLGCFLTDPGLIHSGILETITIRGSETPSRARLLVSLLCVHVQISVWLIVDV